MTFKTFYLFLFLPVLFITGCSDNTVSSDSSVSGRFIDESGQAVEGALVRVFAVKPLDTLVTRLRKEYKDVGCDISDATEFDHRFYGKPLAEGKTKSDGSFSVEGLSGGPYHISITHPQYSWRYIYRTSGSIGDVKTKPVKEINGVLTGNTIWDEAGQDYVVTENATQNGGSLTIKSGVRVRLGSQRRLTVQGGSLLIQGNVDKLVWITSNTDENDKNFHAGIQIIHSNIEIDHMIISGATKGLNLQKVGKGSILNSFFNDNYNSLTLTSCAEDTIRIKNSITRNNEDIAFEVEASMSSATSCILYTDKIALKLLQNAAFGVSNSFVSSNTTSVIVQDGSVIDLKYSEIRGKDYCLGFLSGSSALIAYSNLIASTPVITLSNSNVNALQKIYISQSNLYADEHEPVIHIRSRSEIDLNSVYFDNAGNLSEYERAIIYDYGDSKTVISYPTFTPITTAGIHI